MMMSSIKASNMMLGRVFFRSFNVSFMYIMNSKGPNTDPCGNPLFGSINARRFHNLCYRIYLLYYLRELLVWGYLD